MSVVERVYVCGTCDQIENTVNRLYVDCPTRHVGCKVESLELDAAGHVVTGRRS